MKTKILFALGLVYTCIMCIFLYTAEKRLNLYSINTIASMLIILLIIYSMPKDKDGEKKNQLRGGIYAILFFLINFLATHFVTNKARNKESNLFKANDSKLVIVQKHQKTT